MFKRDFKTKGSIPLSTFLKVYRVGDIVDIKANAAQQKGMPHKYYHGRTGIVYNVTPSSVGVIVYKVVGNRYLEKRVNLRIEHVKHSKCRDGALLLALSHAVPCRDTLSDTPLHAPAPLLQTSSTASSRTPRRRRRPRPRASTSSSSASRSRRASRAPSRPRTTRRKPLRPSRTTRPSKRTDGRTRTSLCFRLDVVGVCGACSRIQSGTGMHRSGRPELSVVVPERQRKLRLRDESSPSGRTPSPDLSPTSLLASPPPRRLARRLPASSCRSHQVDVTTYIGRPSALHSPQRDKAGSSLIASPHFHPLSTPPAVASPWEASQTLQSPEHPSLHRLKPPPRIHRAPRHPSAPSRSCPRAAPPPRPAALIQHHARRRVLRSNAHFPARPRGVRVRELLAPRLGPRCRRRLGGRRARGARGACPERRNALHRRRESLELGRRRASRVPPSFCVAAPG